VDRSSAERVRDAWVSPPVGGWVWEGVIDHTQKMEHFGAVFKLDLTKENCQISVKKPSVSDCIASEGLLLPMVSTPVCETTSSQHYHDVCILSHVKYL